MQPPIVFVKPSPSPAFPKRKNAQTLPQKKGQPSPVARPIITLLEVGEAAADAKRMAKDW